MANDTTIFITILGFLLVVGFVLPYINADYNQQVTVYKSGQALTQDLQNAQDKVTNPTSFTDVGITDVIKSMVSIFFWTAGGIPFWLDATFFMVLRIALVFLLYRALRSGGG